jgi:hypothetical protein
MTNKQEETRSEKIKKGVIITFIILVPVAASVIIWVTFQSFGP